MKYSEGRSLFLKVHAVNERRLNRNECWMSVNAYKFIITVYGTPFIKTKLLVCVFAIAELSFVGP